MKASKPPAPGTRIPYGRQDISDADIQRVIEVLRSDFLTQGPTVPAFEKAVSEYCGANFAAAVNSATSALHIACMALDIGPGDIVWTSPITFVASSNCALYCGGSVDFVDIDPSTYNLCPERLAEKLEQAERDGTLPKLVIPVHLSGQSCDMAAIHGLAQKYGFRVVEDASHAVGGRYRDEPVGSCRYSDITIFSFHPVKIVTSGEGGMAVTNDPELFRRLKLHSSHGITSNPQDMVERDPAELWYYQQISLGFNYRMTDIHAALGLSQLERLDEFIDRRHTIARQYDELLAALPLTRPWQHPDCYSGYHLYLIRLNLQQIDKSQREVFAALHAAGIGANLHYIPVYRQPYYENLGFSRDYCPEAERYYAEVASLPMFPKLESGAVHYVAETLGEILC